MKSLLLIALFAVCPFHASSETHLNTDLTHDEVLSNYLEAHIDYVDFLFTDLLGQLRSVTLPLKQVQTALKNGLKFDGSSIPGFSSIYESDMHLKADLATAEIVSQPDGYKYGRVICDIYRSETEKYEADPRSILKQQLEKAHALGYELLIGPELEFFLFNAIYPLNPIDNNRYFEAENSAFREQQKRGLLDHLERNHIRVEKLHHEVAPGQHEISIEYADALTIADQIILAKQAISIYMESCGLKASFMPKPFSNQNGSGMHVHFSLYDTKNDCNAFYDANDPNYLSLLAHQFIAGVLHCIPELNALINPTINSYKRLVAGYEAPVYLCWATKNRSALIRIPQINETQPRAARAEIRSPDAMSNPYLLFSLLLSAGLKGIEEEQILAPAVNENLYKLSLDQIIQRGIKTLPASLSEAIAALKTSTLATQFFDPRLIQEYITIKEKEIQQFNLCITDWEINHYL